MIYGPATFESDTTGEKEAEEFFTNKETVDWQRFQSFGVVDMKKMIETDHLIQFKNKFESLLNDNIFDRDAYKTLIYEIVPEIQHIETGKFLNDRM